MRPLFNTDNEWDIPALHLSHQVHHLSLPFEPWGVRARSVSRTGIRHFYIDDSKMEGLWKSPDKLIGKGAIAVIEPNFTVASETPRALALYQIYRKRWLAAYWQKYGINIMADIFVAPRHLDLAFLGLPSGWSSYALRGSFSWTESDYKVYWNLAVQKAGHENLTFLIYAGGQAARRIAIKNGWLWMPHYFNKVREDGERSIG